jgi:hypothetical protein
MMSLDQDQSDDDLKAVFDMVDDDQSGLLDKDEVALVMEFFSGTCVPKQAGASASHASVHFHPCRQFCMQWLASNEVRRHVFARRY